MIELTSPQILTLIGVLLFILIGLLFFVARRTRDVQELRQDLNKSHQDFNQLAARFDALTQQNNLSEQHRIRTQAEREGLQIRLTERDEKIAYLSQELDEEQLRNTPRHKRKVCKISYNKAKINLYAKNKNSNS